MQQDLGAGWATGDVDVHIQQAIAPLSVAAVEHALTDNLTRALFSKYCLKKGQWDFKTYCVSIEN